MNSESMLSIAKCAQGMSFFPQSKQQVTFKFLQYPLNKGYDSINVNCNYKRSEEHWMKMNHKKAHKPRSQLKFALKFRDMFSK